MTRRTYKYYDLVIAAFVTVLLCSDLIGAAKAWILWFSTLSLSWESGLTNWWST